MSTKYIGMTMTASVKKDRYRSTALIKRPEQAQSMLSKAASVNPPSRRYYRAHETMSVGVGPTEIAGHGKI